MSFDIIILRTGLFGKIYVQKSDFLYNFCSNSVELSHNIQNIKKCNNNHILAGFSLKNNKKLKKLKFYVSLMCFIFMN